MCKRWGSGRELVLQGRWWVELCCGKRAGSRRASTAQPINQTRAEWLQLVGQVGNLGGTRHAVAWPACLLWAVWVVGLVLWAAV